MRVINPQNNYHPKLKLAHFAPINIQIIPMKVFPNPTPNSRDVFDCVLDFLPLILFVHQFQYRKVGPLQLNQFYFQYSSVALLNVLRLLKGRISQEWG
jgi:hypothetical protein